MLWKIFFISKMVYITRHTCLFHRKIYALSIQPSKNVLETYCESWTITLNHHHTSSTVEHHYSAGRKSEIWIVEGKKYNMKDAHRAFLQHMLSLNLDKLFFLLFLNSILQKTNPLCNWIIIVETTLWTNDLWNIFWSLTLSIFFKWELVTMRVSCK